MDHDRFDRLTRTLAAGQSRRRALSLLAGGLATVFGGGTQAAVARTKAQAKADKEQAEAKKTQTKADKEREKTRRVCGPANGDGCDTHDSCCSGICQGGTCVATIAGTCLSEEGLCGGGTCNCLSANGTLICGHFVCDGGISSQADCSGNSIFAESLSACGGPGCYLPCGPFVCFTGETRIAMADGTSRAIELVQIGDHVFGQTGVNRVEGIMRPTLGSKSLYALNDGPYFVTADHPFLTETGWKAIDPVATAAALPDLAVGRLAVGDRLLTLAGVPVPAGGGTTLEAVIPQLVAVSVERIEATRGDPATPLYNLQLDGDHTYFANEMVVHNR